MQNKKKIFFVIILTIVMTSLCITTFALEPNETTYTQGVGKVFSRSAFLNPSFALIYGNADVGDLKTTSIDIVDDVYDLQYGEITTSQYLKSYTQYWDLPFNSANAVMDNVNAISDTLWDNRSYMLGDTYVDIGQSILYATIRLPSTANAEYEWGTDVSNEDIVIDVNGTLTLAIDRFGAYVAEYTNEGIFLAPLIVYDGYEEYLYITDDVEFKRGNNNEFLNYWEEYFVDVEQRPQMIFPIDITKRATDVDGLSIENIIDIPYYYCYLAPNANNNYQVRMKVKGSNERIAIANVDTLLGDTFIKAEQDCKVEYYVKYSYLRTSINLYGQKIAKIETREYKSTLNNTQGTDIKYAPNELITELQRMVNVDYIYVEDYEVMLYCRRYTTDKPISVVINYDDNITTDGLTNLAEVISQYTLYEDGSAIVDGLPDNDIIGFLNNTAREVLSVPLLYNLSLGMIVSVPIAIAVVMWVLKVFAGG